MHCLLFDVHRCSKNCEGIYGAYSFPDLCTAGVSNDVNLEHGGRTAAERCDINSVLLLFFYSV